MKSLVMHYFRDESGATAIEYGLIAACLAVVILGSMKAAGVTIQDLYQSIVSNFPAP